MKKLKCSRISIPQRLAAFFLVWTMLVTMIPPQLIGAADEVNTTGIGIYNHVLTQLSGVQTNYQVKFYKLQTTPDPPVEGQDPSYRYEEQSLPGEFQLTDSAGSIVYLSNSGGIQLESGRVLNFLDSNNSDLKSFLINNRIARIVITPQLKETLNVQEVKTFEQYSTTDGFSGSESNIDTANSPTGDPAKDTEITSVSKVYLLQYDENETDQRVTIHEESSYKVKQFDLTPMVDLDVHVQWRDTNSDRPNQNDVKFTISRAEGDSGSYEQYPPANSSDTLSRTITVQDSNNIVYTYSVPEQAQNGTQFNYQAEEILPDIANYSITKVDATHFTNYSLRDFTSKIYWNDSAHSADITKNINLDFIKSNFDLIDETDPDHPQNIPFSYTSTEFDALTEAQNYVRDAYEKDAQGNYHLPMTYVEKTDSDGKKYYELKFKNLFEITEDGTAKIYSIKQKTDQQKIDVSAVGTLSEDYAKNNGNDAYLVSAENTGVRSNIVDRAYDGGKLNFLLTGTTTFEGPLEWADIDNQENRKNIVAEGNAGDFILYRYIIDPDNPNSYQMVAQVGTWTIRDVEYTENGQTKHKYIYADSEGKPIAIDKYDNSGKEYYYFAKERLSSALPGYTSQYQFITDETKYPFDEIGKGNYNSSAVFPNGARVKNSLTGSVAYGVDAK